MDIAAGVQVAGVNKMDPCEGTDLVVQRRGISTPKIRFLSLLLLEHAMIFYLRDVNTQIMKHFQNNEFFMREVLEHAGGGRKSKTFITMALENTKMSSTEIKEDKMNKSPF